jgi:hypothetical protein
MLFVLFLVLFVICHYKCITEMHICLLVNLYIYYISISISISNVEIMLCGLLKWRVSKYQFFSNVFTLYLFRMPILSSATEPAVVWSIIYNNYCNL